MPRKRFHIYPTTTNPDRVDDNQLNILILSGSAENFSSHSDVLFTLKVNEKSLRYAWLMENEMVVESLEFICPIADIESNFEFEFSLLVEANSSMDDIIFLDLFGETRQFDKAVFPVVIGIKNSFSV